MFNYSIDNRINPKNHNFQKNKWLKAITNKKISAKKIVENKRQSVKIRLIKNENFEKDYKNSNKVNKENHIKIKKKVMTENKYFINNKVLNSTFTYQQKRNINTTNKTNKSNKEIDSSNKIKDFSNKNNGINSKNSKSNINSVDNNKAIDNKLLNKTIPLLDDKNNNSYKNNINYLSKLKRNDILEKFKISGKTRNIINFNNGNVDCNINTSELNSNITNNTLINNNIDNDNLILEHNKSILSINQITQETKANKEVSNSILTEDLIKIYKEETDEVVKSYTSNSEKKKNYFSLSLKENNKFKLLFDSVNKTTLKKIKLSTKQNSKEYIKIDQESQNLYSQNETTIKQTNISNNTCNLNKILFKKLPTKPLNPMNPMNSIKSMNSIKAMNSIKTIISPDCKLNNNQSRNLRNERSLNIHNFSTMKNKQSNFPSLSLQNSIKPQNILKVFNISSQNINPSDNITSLDQNKTNNSFYSNSDNNTNKTNNNKLFNKDKSNGNLYNKTINNLSSILLNSPNKLKMKSEKFKGMWNKLESTDNIANKTFSILDTSIRSNKVFKKVEEILKLKKLNNDKKMVYLEEFSKARPTNFGKLQGTADRVIVSKYNRIVEGEKHPELKIRNKLVNFNDYTCYKFKKMFYGMINPNDYNVSQADAFYISKELYKKDSLKEDESNED